MYSSDEINNYLNSIVDEAKEIRPDLAQLLSSDFVRQGLLATIFSYQEVIAKEPGRIFPGSASNNLLLPGSVEPDSEKNPKKFLQNAAIMLALSLTVSGGMYFSLGPKTIIVDESPGATVNVGANKTTIEKGIDTTKQIDNPEESLNWKQITLYTVHFPSGESNIPKREEIKIEQLASYLEENPNINIKVNGYTDGTPGVEQTSHIVLSHSRAEEVKNKLEEYGIDSNRIEISAHGYDRPIISNGKEDKSLSRRVEFTYN